jgi:copper chaperone CopZ
MSVTQTKYFVEGMKCDGCITNGNKALADVLGSSCLFGADIGRLSSCC